MGIGDEVYRVVTELLSSSVDPLYATAHKTLLRGRSRETESLLDILETLGQLSCDIGVLARAADLRAESERRAGRLDAAAERQTIS